MKVNSKNNSANHWNFTNIGTAHDEGFEDAEKNQGKTKIIYIC
jgi:hypothetical protein